MLLRLLQKWGSRRPYFDIHGADGTLYMGRWWLFGGSAGNGYDGWRDARTDAGRGWMPSRFDAWIGKRFAARLHHIAREDRARDFHNHPCAFVSIVLDGWYIERLPLDQAQDSSLDKTHYRDVLRASWSIAFRRANDRHTIVRVSPGGVWTIFAMGRKAGTRGFFRDGQFINWRSYTAAP